MQNRRVEGEEGWGKAEMKGLESGRKQVTSERPEARSEQEAEDEEHGGRNIGRTSVAELCLHPFKRATQHCPRLVPKGSFQSLFQALLYRKPF